MLPPRIFSRGHNLPKSFPKRCTFGRSNLSKIVPQRSTLHRPKPVVSADKTSSVVSAGDTYICCVCRQDISCVSRQDICGLPRHPFSIDNTGGRRRRPPVFSIALGCLGRPHMSCLQKQQVRLPQIASSANTGHRFWCYKGTHF